MYSKISTWTLFFVGGFVFISILIIVLGGVFDRIKKRKNKEFWDKIREG